jgi:hypothetical protein
MGKEDLEKSAIRLLKEKMISREMPPFRLDSDSAEVQFLLSNGSLKLSGKPKFYEITHDGKKYVKHYLDSQPAESA